MKKSFLEIFIWIFAIFIFIWAWFIVPYFAEKYFSQINIYIFRIFSIVFPLMVYLIKKFRKDKKKNFLLYFSLFSIIIVILIMLITDYNGLKQSNVCFKDSCFNVELARTSQERVSGLMFKQSLDSDKGMLFIFHKEGEYSFWMKNMLIPLDIIWIDKNEKVVWIEENIQPCLEQECESIKSDQKAKYVLELNADTVDRINLKIGDELVFDF